MESIKNFTHQQGFKINSIFQKKFFSEFCMKILQVGNFQRTLQIFQLPILNFLPSKFHLKDLKICESIDLKNIGFVPCIRVLGTPIKRKNLHSLWKVSTFKLTFLRKSRFPFFHQDLILKFYISYMRKTWEISSLVLETESWTSEKNRNAIKNDSIQFPNILNFHIYSYAFYNQGSNQKLNTISNWFGWRTLSFWTVH